MEVNYMHVTTQQEFDTVLPEIMKMPYWVFDTETTGLDAHIDRVLLLQIGNQKRQFVIEPAEIDISALTPKLESETFLKWGHNLLFDYKMMKGTFGITMEGLRDTMIAERIFNAGLNKFQYSLADVCKKYLRIEIDKTLQTSFIRHEGKFSSEQISYAALDCVYPDKIWPILMGHIRRLGLLRTFEIECNAIPAFADIEFYGMLLDKSLWEKNIQAAAALRDGSFELFMQEVAPFVGPDIFGRPMINLNSSSQILALFEKLFPGELVNMKKKPSADSDTLEAVLAKHPDTIIIRALLDYRMHAKNTQTYGYSYIDAIHPKTGRLHPRIDQLGTETGRPTGRTPNMLNLPKDQKYRTPWNAGPGRKIITCDYAACELRILASHSKDPLMCKGFNAGVDYHNYSASQFIEDGNGQLIPLEKVDKELRGIAKTINFGLAYGMGLTKFANTVGLPIEKAKKYFMAFKERFNVAMKYLEYIKNIALKPRRGNSIGYSETLLGRKRFYRIPRVPDILNKTFFGEQTEAGMVWTSNEETPEVLDYNPKDPWDEKLPEGLQSFYGSVASIKRQGGNSVIQGGNADITKIAMYLVRKDIRDYEKKHNSGKYVAHVALQVYDELLLDCPEDMVEYFSKMLQARMIEAGREVIKEVPVVVDCTVGDHWIK